uniref:Uncharacterized protein n=1 Tax=Meloidogyne floridensis TaxID=298350 RepID=A0A915P8W0_9BILA
MSQYDQPPKDGDLYDQPPPVAPGKQADSQLYDQPPPADEGEKKGKQQASKPAENKGDYEVITDEEINSIILSVKPPKKPSKENADVEKPAKAQQTAPPPKPKKKVEVKSKCCIATWGVLAFLTLALAIFTSLAAFCQLEETIPKEYPCMSQIGQPMKTADLYDQPPPPEAAASAAPPANDQLYEQPPPIDDGKQSTAVTKSEEAQRPTTNPTQKGEYENIDDMQVSFLGSVKGKKKAGKQKGKKHGKSDTPKGQTASGNEIHNN